MFTKEGRYFTGHKLYWHATPEPAGHVRDIEVRVTAFDNEGRKFTSPLFMLDADRVIRAQSSVREHTAVIEELVRECYEKGCAAELAAKAAKADEVKDVESEGQEASAEAEGTAEGGSSEASTPEQDRSDASHAEGEGSGDVVEDGQESS